MIHKTPGGVMCVERVGPLFVQATSPDKPISDSEWRAYVELVMADAAANQMAPCAIQYSLTQSPNAAQRKLVVERTGGEMFHRFSLVSASAVVRGSITTINWLLSRRETQTRAFAPGQERTAFEWMAQHTAFDINEAMERLDAAAKAVGYSGIK